MGEAQTRPLYTLFDLGGFPAMAQGVETSVRGEVFGVSEEVLEALALEGHPHWNSRASMILTGGMHGTE